MDPYWDIKKLVADNYNAHKSEKNKELEPDHVSILYTAVTTDVSRYFATTKRSDGLLYEVHENLTQGKTTIYLYNRIARRVITKEQDA